MTAATEGLRPGDLGAPAPALAGGAAVVDAVLHLAADGDLHRLGDRHGAQAGRAAVNYVNQFGPFWAQLFLALKLNVRLQRLVVPADPGVPGHQHLAVHRPQGAQDLHRPAHAQGKHARAGAAGLQAPGAGAAGRCTQALGAAASARRWKKAGWKVKLQQRTTPRGQGWMVAARPAPPTRSATWPRTAPSCWCAWAGCPTAT
jgi:cytochrome c biogenesis protein